MSYFPDIGPLIRAIAIILVVSVPLALWKLVEIAIWLSQFVHFGAKP